MSTETTYDTLDLSDLNKELYKVGKLTINIIDLLNLSSEEKDIIVWRDRLNYIAKHKNDFETEEQFYKHIEAIPEIIQNPDYVGLHPNGKSLEFIKRIDENMLVAVRLSDKKKLAFRTSYPIKQSKLNNYIAAGRVKCVNPSLQA